MNDGTQLFQNAMVALVAPVMVTCLIGVLFLLDSILATLSRDFVVHLFIGIFMSFCRTG